MFNAKSNLPLRSENRRVLLIKSPEMVKKILKTCFNVFTHLEIDMNIDYYF